MKRVTLPLLATFAAVVMTAACNPGSSPLHPVKEVEPNDTQAEATFIADASHAYFAGTCTHEHSDFYRYSTSTECGTFAFLEWKTGNVGSIAVRLYASNGSFTSSSAGQAASNGFEALASSPVTSSFSGEAFLEVMCLDTTATIDYTGGFDTTPC